jgi:hypothetical protein
MGCEVGRKLGFLLGAQVEITILKRQGLPQSLSGSGQHKEERIVTWSLLQHRSKEVLPLDFGHRLDPFNDTEERDTILVPE